MKVLLILGCLRKGNTYKVTQQIEERMKEMGDVEFLYLFFQLLPNSRNKLRMT